MDFVRPSRSVALQLVAGRGHYDSVVEAAMRAERSVWISTANLKELMVEDANLVPGRRRVSGRKTYRSVLVAMEELAARGVEMRILHAAIPSGPFREEFDRHARLFKGGLELRLCPRVHMKAVIIDGAMLYLGSANWTGAGLGVKGEGRRNFEVGVITEDEAMLDEVQAMFDHIWRGAACKTCRLREECGAPLDGVAPVKKIARRPSIRRRRR
ncbi:MAG: phospholipase D family protein [Sandaracinaceae bacterium]|nr:phospholipase D family protein [Sandaracinaceae bacterium]